MINFGVHDVSTSRLVPAPGWAYVPDNGSQTPIAAVHPMPRKRARKPTLGVNPREYTAQQDVKLLRELAQLDRENHRDVSVPIPPKKYPEQSTIRGSSHGKVTAAVRKILQSNKTFANYLADSEAAQANSAISNGSGGAFYTASTPIPLATPLSRANSVVAPADTVTNNSSQRRSGKRKISTNGNREISRGGIVPTTRKSSLTAQAFSPTGVKGIENKISMEEKISSLIAASTITAPPLAPDTYDNDPLLTSSIPVMPSEDELKRLLAHPPLTYLEARGPLVEEDHRKPARHFCERCGYWAKVKCVKCGGRVCNLDCYKEHKEECSRYGP